MPCELIEIQTPKNIVLNGLWFGPKRPKRAAIFIHGLTGSVFSMQALVSRLVDKDTAVLAFNNRGFEQIAEVKKRRARRSEWMPAGAGHEVFTDCVDDIQGTVDFARKRSKGVFIVGHSTGCQKSFFWAAKKKGKGVKGIVLLSPLSDYAVARAEDSGGKLARSVAYARKLVAAGRSRELMPPDLGPWFACDAQRFLSLYTPESPEDVFPYAQSKPPRAMNSVRVPTLVLLAAEDEHGDRPVRELARWFDENMTMPHKVSVIAGTGHSFKDGEKAVQKAIARFMTEC